MSRIPTLALAFTLALSACGDRDATPTLAERAGALTANMAIDTILVDGQPVQVGYQEASGATFPVPFTVRVPNPMRVETDRTDDGESVRFVMGAPPAEASWSVVVLADSLGEAGARAEALRVAEAMGAVPDEGNPTTWTLAPYATTTSTDGEGTVRLGRHGGRFFLAVTTTAAAAAADFRPRAAYLDEHWRWTDDGSSLAD